MRSRNSSVPYLLSTFLGGGFAFELIPEFEVEPLLSSQFYSDVAIRSVGVFAIGIGAVVIVGGLLRVMAEKCGRNK
jgi:hypothetical protein